jgi:hypothetical protein
VVSMPSPPPRRRTKGRGRHESKSQLKIAKNVNVMGDVVADDVASSRGDARDDMSHDIANENVATFRWGRFICHVASWALRTGIVLIPIGWLNVWPKVSYLLAHQIDQSNWGTVAFQCFLLFLLSQIWPAIRQTYLQPWHWALRGALGVALVTFGVGLVAINATFAVDSIGIARDSVSDKNRTKITQKAEWTEQRDGKDGKGGKKKELADKQAERSSLKFEATSQDAINTAKTAADNARIARDASNADCRAWFHSMAECTMLRGEYEQRVAKLEKLQHDLATQVRAKTLNTEIEQLSEMVEKLTEKINALGDVPAHADPFAARISSLSGERWTEKQVTEGLPIVWGASAEVAALFGPFVLDLAFAFLASALGRRVDW